MASSEELVNVINQVFALFRVNYHNQYHAAFAETVVLNQAKKLWLETLGRFSPEVILRGARKAIETCEYLPTLHKMIQCCQGSIADHGLPDVHSAYLEACHAPSPKAAYHWSHPAVYHAGRNSDWFFLANNPERVTLPVFKACYEALCEKVLQGETLPPPQLPSLPHVIEKPLSGEENAERLAQLRKELDI